METKETMEEGRAKERMKREEVGVPVGDKME